MIAWPKYKPSEAHDRWMCTLSELVQSCKMKLSGFLIKFDQAGRLWFRNSINLYGRKIASIYKNQNNNYNNNSWFYVYVGQIVLGCHLKFCGSLMKHDQAGRLWCQNGGKIHCCQWEKNGQVKIKKKFADFMYILGDLCWGFILDFDSKTLFISIGEKW